MQIPSSLLTLLATSTFLLSVHANPVPNPKTPKDVFGHPCRPDPRCGKSGFGWIEPDCGMQPWCSDTSTPSTIATSTTTTTRIPEASMPPHDLGSTCWMDRRCSNKPPPSNVPWIPSAYCHFVGGCIQTTTATVLSTVTTNAILTAAVSSRAPSTPAPHAPSTLTLTSTPTLTTTFTVLETATATPATTTTTTKTKRKHGAGANMVCHGADPDCYEMWDAITVTLQRRARATDSVPMPEDNEDNNEDNNDDNDNDDKYDEEMMRIFCMKSGARDHAVCL